jgi:serine/threonine protein kinase
MSTSTSTCDIVIPGYTLAERIGSGGYAEVWRAEAPGGIEKAVKVVHGYYDDEFASQELKALERIKGVRHPFLLSLERFEIVSGRLAILTELADMSLDQRLRQCRAEGLPGIPRDELLRYMSDAAEALDFLAQRHNLLHLDIKPENLLVLGDHIKVADFGLVKELASRTQNSLVSGMTPTYASPEMFDDEPTAQSDQYSLAIVYQEMLVGTLPFPGRTAAQLAKQHVLAEPQLQSLPACDRAVVGRALAKNPVDRYPTCRAFVDALRCPQSLSSVATPTEIPRPEPAVPRPVAPAPDDTRPPSYCTTIRRPAEPKIEPAGATVTQPVQRSTANGNAARCDAAVAIPVVPEETIDVAVPEINAEEGGGQPTLYVALGGIGVQLLCRLRELVAPGDSPQSSGAAIEFLALDTDRDELREACGSRRAAPLSPDDVLHLPLRLPKSYDDDREILTWVSRRWLYNIPRSLETRGYRPLGRVALVDHVQRVREAVDGKLERLTKTAGTRIAGGTTGEPAVKVVILTGTGGGTGGGMAIDVANAVRTIAAERDVNVEVHGFFVCNCFGSNNSSPLLAANTFSLLVELNHAMAFGNEGPGERALCTQLFESRNRPFESVYWLPDRGRTGDSCAADVFAVLPRYLAFERTTEGAAAIRACRTIPTPREELFGRSLAIRKLGYASLADEGQRSLTCLASELAEAVKLHRQTIDTSDNWERRVRREAQAAAVPRLQPGSDGNPDMPPAVVPVNDASPLALRGRFQDYLSLEFTSEVLRQIERLLESRDDRGRPRLVPRDAKLLADTARASVGAIVEQGKQQPETRNRFVESQGLRELVAAASRRVLGSAIDQFDYKQPDRYLSVDALEGALSAECPAFLQQCSVDAEFGTAVSSLVELDQLAKQALERASTELLQCGCDRRTLVVAGRESPRHEAVAEFLRAERPLSTSVGAAIDDVVVVVEESGMSPRSLAGRLERVFPGVSAAARRLLTRVDIEWKDID